MTETIRSLPVEIYPEQQVHFVTHSLYAPKTATDPTPRWVKLVLDLDPMRDSRVYYTLDTSTDRFEEDGMIQTWTLPAITCDEANRVLAQNAHHFDMINRDHHATDEWNGIELGPHAAASYDAIWEDINAAAQYAALRVDYLENYGQEWLDTVVDQAIVFNWTAPEQIDDVARVILDIPNEVVIADLFAQVMPAMRERLNAVRALPV